MWLFGKTDKQPKPAHWRVYFWVDSNQNEMQYATIDAVSEREARRKFRASKHGGKTITAVEPGTPDRVRVFG